MRSEKLRRSASGLHACAELDHARDHVGHYRQVAHRAAVQYCAVVGTGDVDDRHFTGDGYGFGGRADLEHYFEGADIARQKDDIVTHFFFEARDLDRDGIVARHQQGHDESAGFIRLRRDRGVRVRIHNNHIGVRDNRVLRIFHGPLNGTASFLGPRDIGETQSNCNEEG
jgi:hypothetical protein